MAAVVAGVTSAALIGRSISGLVEKSTPAHQTAVDEQYRSDRNRVEVEVEYKVNWYVERRWPWVATTAKGRDFPT